jgi:hypothetical protein
MAHELTWTFQLYDKMSAPAKTIAGTPGVVDKMGTA